MKKSIKTPAKTMSKRAAPCAYLGPKKGKVLRVYSLKRWRGGYAPPRRPYRRSSLDIVAKLSSPPCPVITMLDMQRVSKHPSYQKFAAHRSRQPGFRHTGISSFFPCYAAPLLRLLRSFVYAVLSIKDFDPLLTFEVLMDSNRDCSLETQLVWRRKKDTDRWKEVSTFNLKTFTTSG